MIFSSQDKEADLDDKDRRILELEYQLARANIDNMRLRDQVVLWRNECDKARAQHHEYKTRVLMENYGGSSDEGGVHGGGGPSREHDGAQEDG